MPPSTYNGFEKAFEEEFVTIWKYQNKNIALIDFNPYKDIDLEEAKKVEKVSLEILDTSILCYGITKLNEGTSMTADARAYFAECDLTQKYTGALAVVILNLAHRMLYNFYIKFNKPDIIHKGFSDVDNAVKWLIKRGA